MRTMKKADVRKSEILDAASILFGTKGFDDTSVTDIMNAVGIAKGTLYHHFKSKEDIMDALIEQQTFTILETAKKASEDQSVPVIERLISTILALHVDTQQTEGQNVIEQLHKPQNALMHQKTKRIILQNLPPVLSGIVEDGIAEKIFDTSYPLESMEMALCYMDSVLDDDMFELSEKQWANKIMAFIYQLEKLLGVKPGQLDSLKKAFIGTQEV